MKRIIALMLALALLTALPLALGSCADPVVYVEMSIEDYGKIIIRLDREAAPKTVKNFVSLVEDGFYDGLTFHRVLEGFMIQGGDPNGNGSGGSRKKIKGEFMLNGYDNPISHTRGTISMARTDASYDSASSQFFICNADCTDLDGSYAAFGRVVEGMDVVDAITENTKRYTDAYSGLVYYDWVKPVIEYARVLDGYGE